tara:strand:- start:200 stop:958 length:759 start_codon:yes stop_codon:yes gene_type:complete
MKLLFIYLWSFWCYLVLTIFFIIGAPIGILVSFISPNLFSFYTFYLAKIILLSIGVRVVVHGDFPPKKKNPYIYISNHSSYLDPVLNCYLMKRKYKYLAKSEVLSWPLFGSVVKKHIIAVKRELKESRFNSMSLMKDNILNGYSIVLYPEGGWKDESNEHPYDIQPNEILNKFRNGAFRLAISSKTNIIPISLCNAKKIHSSDTMLFHPGKVIIYIHKEIDSKRFLMNEEGIKGLNQKCYSIIYKDLIKHDN